MKTFGQKYIKLAEDFLFKVERTCLESDFFVHNHDFSELVVISGGSGIHIIDDREYPVKAGDVFVIKGDTSHGFKDVSCLQLYNIMYDIRWISHMEDELKKMTGFQALFVLEPYYRKEHRFESRLQLSAEWLDRTVRHLNCMYEEYTTRKEGYKSIIRAYFTTLAVMLSRYYSSSGSRMSRKLFSIADAITYMESNFTQPIRLEELAARAFMSARHFSRVFKENYHTTPLEYLIRLRLNHACNLLAGSSLNITDIAQECGFSDSNYFARIFKQKTGLSPTQYRKNIEGRMTVLFQP